MFFVVIQKPSGDALIERFRTDFCYDGSVAYGDAVKCVLCGAFISMRIPSPPFRIQLETWGDGFGDLAFWMDDFLASARFRHNYEKSGLKGLSRFEKVEIQSTRKNRSFSGESPEYFRTMPSIGSAQIDVKSSHIEWSDDGQLACDVCISGHRNLLRWKHVIIDESTWNGDDIFYAYGLPGVLITSQRFANWAMEQKFKNLILLPSHSISRDFYPI